MNVIQFPERSTWSVHLARPVMQMDEIESRVKPILEAVRHSGDAALKEFTEKFDKVSLSKFRVSEEEIASAILQVPKDLQAAIQTAQKHIEAFHAAQKDEVKFIYPMKGISCWRKSVAIEKVGLYIPGGTAPLFSTVLMLGVPAVLAGCEEIVLCSPANQEGNIHPAILYAANLVGIKKIYKAGGAQAIAAMAFGTETIPKVDKIFGPGNQYVTAAKQMVLKYGLAIDMPAGPSELMVYADDSCLPAFVASDLLSQAEHGTDSQVILVTTSEKVVEAVEKEITLQLGNLPRKEIAAAALKNSKAILVQNQLFAIELINAYAPEHLILAIENFEQTADKIKNAGSVFLGNYTPESAGDYASGTNHTLPTNGYARAYSGVSLDSFVKKITFQHISQEGINQLGPVIEAMAAAEELQAHKNAVTLRINKLH